MKTIKQVAAMSALIAFAFSCGDTSTSTQTATSEAQLVEKDTAQIRIEKEQKIASQKAAFFNSYQSCKSSLTEKIELNSKDDVWNLLALFNVYAGNIHDYRNNKDADVIAVYSDYKKCLSLLQAKMFPLMRKAYLIEAKNMLFRHNIDVSSSKPYTAVMFTGYLFANNANIEDVNNMVWKQLNDLRFKQVRYRWSKVDEEYTYYTIKSPADKDIVYN